jgi:hypothetical protein
MTTSERFSTHHARPRDGVAALARAISHLTKWLVAFETPH